MRPSASASASAHRAHRAHRARRARRARRAALAGLGLLLLTACTSTDGGSSGEPTASVARTGALAGRVTVYAAASLQESFTEIGKDFEAAHPGLRVVFNFGPSSGLAAQITQGAPVDVFASASTATMDQVVADGSAATSQVFASNSMEVAVPSANPAGVTALADLARPGVKVALCQAAVPCGSVAATVLAKAGLTVRPVTEETDVKAVLTKVGLGEVDAGVVYVTDVRAAGARVKGITIPAAVNASTQYPIAATTRAPNRVAAAAFTDFVLSAAGTRALVRAGFARP